MLNSDPSGEVSLSYIGRLMRYCFPPIFQAFLLKHKTSIKRKIQLYTHWINIFSLSSRVCLSGMKMGVNKVCTL